MTSRLTTLVLIVAGCGAGADSRVAWQTERDTAGDTVIARTRAFGEGVEAAGSLTVELTIGSMDGPEETMFGRLGLLAMHGDGTLYAFDGQAPALRAFDAEGRFLRTLGRAGSGPGEYRMAMGLGVMPDGRVALYDLGNSRINFYAPDGAPAGEWPVQGGMSPLVLRAHVAQALTVDTAGQAWVMAILNPPGASGGWQIGALHYSSTGTFVDSVLPPDRAYGRTVLVAEDPRARATITPAYSPTIVWTVTRDGAIASGLSSEYRIDITRPDGTTQRIEKYAPPVPIADDERTQRIDEATAAMRRTDPGWRWNAAPLPHVKPYFNALHAARDGRLWVRLHSPSVRTEQPPPAESPPGTPPQVSWREPDVYDVFTSTGDYLGRIAVPDRTNLLVMEGDRAWGVYRDSLDVQYLRRFRITFPE